MPAYIAVDIVIDDPSTYERYKQLAPPSIAKYGGRYLLRGGTATPLEGDWSPARFVILEFASADVARQWWSSPEYAEAKALRQSCARTQMLVLDGPSLDPSRLN